ncbi:uncharacterized protein C8Q71DRAFT_325791 [Rhodofomes roseus]|uniref:Arrestin-like N-terminal domain-containing protein n=1 Tax=Rhodofomes roseus TaxID=34475 RepID=A0ABQ8KSB6_9APHY|nr:uncharacterized protein C8Q71DRAFT_325791 [Rhodofomes roseus]KAH9841351.1 hypothetical protein C8Q71DRAFT_325791 [Rhodofomes roseus]
MSASSLPAYRPSSFARSPASPVYTPEPQAYEQRLALNRVRERPSTEFVKQSKTGGLSLRLSEQEDNATLPAYGCGDSVEGTVDLAKPESANCVEVRVEGSLRLKEIAEGGTTSHKLCLSVVTLWNRETDRRPCPASLPFSLTLPTTFSDGKETYPLPPTHQARLPGVPGFDATIEYIVCAAVHKGKSSSLLRIGSSTVCTPFVYYPRSRPAVPLPRAARQLSGGYPTFLDSPEWRCYRSIMAPKVAGLNDILTKFYVPAARVFSLSEPIPFYVVFASSAISLAAFLPLGPTTTRLSGRQPTRVQLLRQTNVDVRYVMPVGPGAVAEHYSRNEVVFGTKTDIWQTVEIGEGAFRHMGDGADWICFAGELRVNSQIKLGGFKAGGLSLKDYLVLSMTPPDPSKTPYSELRQVVPVRLTTDSWSSDGAGQTFSASDYSIPILASESRHPVNAPVPGYRPA